MKKHLLRALALLLLLPLLALPARAAEAQPLETLPLPELIQAALHSDGAATEGYADQLGHAFRADPRALLSALAEVDGTAREELLEILIFDQNGWEDADFQAQCRRLTEAEGLTEAEADVARQLRDLCVPAGPGVGAEPDQPDKTLLHIGLAVGAGALVLGLVLSLLVRGRAAKTMLAIFCLAMAAVVGVGAFFALRKPREVVPETQPAQIQTVQTLPPETVPPETEAAQPEILFLTPEDSGFVRVVDFIPGIQVDLRYAGEDNFTGGPVYGFRDAWLRYGTVKKLAAVQTALEARGLSLKIWDAYRPTEAQFRLWDAWPDARYVADPNSGFSSHSRGGTVDLTVVDAQGRALEMPTDFDDFTALADRDYSDCTDAARENALLLEGLMREAGFKPYAAEWWHFSDTDTYPVEEAFLPGPSEIWYADCQEFITLRAAPDTGAEALAKIPAGEPVRVCAWEGDFAQAAWQGQTGYVLTAYLREVP